MTNDFAGSTFMDGVDNQDKQDKQEDNEEICPDVENSGSGSAADVSLMLVDLTKQQEEGQLEREEQQEQEEEEQEQHQQHQQQLQEQEEQQERQQQDEQDEERECADRVPRATSRGEKRRCELDEGSWTTTKSKWAFGGFPSVEDVWLANVFFCKQPAKVRQYRLGCGPCWCLLSEESWKTKRVEVLREPMWCVMREKLEKCVVRNFEVEKLKWLIHLWVFHPDVLYNDVKFLSGDLVSDQYTRYKLRERVVSNVARYLADDFEDLRQRKDLLLDVRDCYEVPVMNHSLLVWSVACCFESKVGKDGNKVVFDLDTCDFGSFLEDVFNHVIVDDDEDTSGERQMFGAGVGDASAEEVGKIAAVRSNNNCFSNEFALLESAFKEQQLNLVGWYEYAERQRKAFDERWFQFGHKSFDEICCERKKVARLQHQLLHEKRKIVRLQSQLREKNVGGGGVKTRRMKNLEISKGKKKKCFSV